MSNRQSVLTALIKHGQSTYDDLEQSTGISRDKLRIAINDAKKAGHVQVGKDDVTNQPAYTATPAGREWNKANMGSDLPEQPAAKVMPERALASNAENFDSLSQELKQVRQQLALAQKMRDEHFEQAEDYKSQLDICESANKHWIALAEFYGCDSLEALRTHIETIIRGNKSQSNDAVDVKDVATAYLIKIPGRKPITRLKPDVARQTALIAAHIHGRADVIALVPVGTARAKKQISTEWQEA